MNYQRNSRKPFILFLLILSGFPGCLRLKDPLINELKVEGKRLYDTVAFYSTAKIPQDSSEQMLFFERHEKAMYRINQIESELNNLGDTSFHGIHLLKD